MLENPSLLRLDKLMRLAIVKRIRIVFGMGIRCILLAAFFALFSTGPLGAQSPDLVTLVKAGRLLDPRTGNVLSPAAVLIENGKIKEVGSPSRVQADAQPGVKTID